MKNRVLNQVALAFSILAIIAFAVAFSPAFLAVIFALLAFLTVIVVFAVFIVCGFISLVSSNGNLWEWVKTFCMDALNWAGELFTIVPEMARFCFADMAPICGWIGVGLGVVGIVLSVIALATNKKTEDEGSERSKAAEEKTETGKPKKKKKSDRTISIICVVLSSVFTALNVIGLIVVKIISYRLFL